MTEHMVIFREPYLKYIFQGTKTIESRWSQQRRTPFKKVDAGDKCYLKLTGGLVMGEAFVSKVECYSQLDLEEIRLILHDYHDQLRIQDPFKPKCFAAKYVSLIWLERVKKYNSEERFGWYQSGQQGWIVLKEDWKKDIIGGGN